MYRREKPLPPPTDPLIRTVEVRALGDRGYLVGRVVVPVELLVDFEAAWQGFHAKYPHYTLDQFLRYVLIKGTIVAVRRVLYNNIPYAKWFLQGSD
jgi:hypothetical protein